MILAPSLAPLSPGHHIATTGDDLRYMVRVMQSSPSRGWDTETSGLRLFDGKRVIGYSMGIIPPGGGWPICFYVPFGHASAEPQANRTDALAAFKDALTGATEMIGHNMKFDLEVARTCGMEAPESAQIHDTLIQAGLVYEKRQLQLESVIADEGCGRWRDPFEMKSQVEAFVLHRSKEHRIPLKKDDKRAKVAGYYTRYGHAEVPVSLEGEYSCRDVSHTLCLDAKLRAKAMGAGLTFQDRRARLYANEMLLVRALAEMEIAGQYVDKDYMWQLGEALEIELEERGRALDAKFGFHIKWSNDQAVRDFLYKGMRLPVVKMTDGGRLGLHKKPAVDREALLSLQSHHPGIVDLTEYRSILKVIQSFSFSVAWEVQKDGKVHSSFNQFGTDSGRLSSEKPNFQNLPARHEVLSKKIRDGWPIPEGMARVYADYSQIELRVLGFYTGCQMFINAYRSPAYDAYRRGEIDYDHYRWYRRAEPEVDVHGSTARTIFHIDHSHPSWKLKRSAAKIANFGLAYGGGPALLMGDPNLRMPEGEAKDFMERYHYAAPEIRSSKDSLLSSMRSKRGTPWFVNWAGRTVHGPRLRHPDDDLRAEEERSMFACLIQGSAGELTRFSLVRAYQAFKAGKLPTMASSTVHDEIQFDCSKADAPYVAHEVQRLMEDFDLGGMPVVADLEATTTTWAQKKKFDVHNPWAVKT